MKGLSKLPKLILLLSWLIVAFGTFGSSRIDANSFSGNDCNQYSCLDVLGDGDPVDQSAGDASCPPGVKSTSQGFVCVYQSGTEVIASLNPPQFRVLEFWFVRILYAVWALAGIFFTFVLIWIGFYYMTSFGNEIALGEVVKRFRNWMIGIALVFLSYPALNTFFSVLSIDRDNSCYSELELPGFQFFFPTACGTSQVNTVNGLIASCTNSCQSGQGFFSFFDPSNCASICNSAVGSCSNNTQNQDPVSGTPIFSLVELCYREQLCFASLGQASECQQISDDLDQEQVTRGGGGGGNVQ